MVVRDDLFPGGTKARFAPILFAEAEEVAYATPAEGGAQTALSTVAAQMGRKLTLFVAKRQEKHARTVSAAKMGANIVEIKPGYLSVVQKRCLEYCAQTGAKHVQFGVNHVECHRVLVETAKRITRPVDEVWAAAGSGVLMRALAEAFPKAKLNAVEVGRKLRPDEVAGATIHASGMKFSQPDLISVPFACDPHYDAKAWRVCIEKKGIGEVLFWNVTGPARI